jgi:hypothetical protein
MKKNAVAATKAIEINQNEIPTKSSDSKLLLAEAKDGAATNATVDIISLIRP